MKNYLFEKAVQIIAKGAEVTWDPDDGDGILYTFYFPEIKEMFLAHVWNNDNKLFLGINDWWNNLDSTISPEAELFEITTLRAAITALRTLHREVKKLRKAEAAVQRFFVESEEPEAPAEEAAPAEKFSWEDEDIIF